MWTPGPQGLGGRGLLTHPSETPRSRRAEQKPLDLGVTSRGATAGITLSVRQCPALPSPSSASPLPRCCRNCSFGSFRFFPRRALRRFGSQLALFAFALIVVMLCKCVYQLLPFLVPDPSSAGARGFPGVWVTLTDSRKEHL